MNRVGMRSITYLPYFATFLFHCVHGTLVFYYLFGVITFLPPMYGCNAAGIVTLPSACK